MASSFIDQTPAIIHLIQRVKHSKVLDIGKGFGKYGFLIHEYIGIDNTRKLNPSASLKAQSNIQIDAVEIDSDLMLPHLDQLYNHIYFEDILTVYTQLPNYDLVLMIDIIEHIDKTDALGLLKYFVEKGTNVLIATPKHFFEQTLYESAFENHVSHWTPKDFRSLGFLNVQYINAGALYLLSAEKLDIRGFGNSWLKKIRRIAKAIRNEL